MTKAIFTAIAAMLLSMAAYAQDINVRGVVLSAADDEPLYGASVFCDANSKGVSTDLDGNFTLSVPQGATIRVTYVGFREAILPAEANMKIFLQENSEMLDEVVVTGYQIQRKADLTGAVAVMNLKQPVSENSGNIMNSMAGKLPGVNVVPDAAPGGTGTIRVRGMSTANSSNDPLYIIDGVPTDNLNMINPADIETMQVLKDAASASIYGSRAANGVVVITTKTAKGDKMHIDIQYAASAQTIAKRYNMLNATQWGEAYWQASANSGLAPSHPLYGNGTTPVLQPFVNGDPNYPTTETDWQDQVYHTAWTNNLTASVSNATEKSQMLFSMNFIDQNGNIKETFYRRYSARLNSRYDFNKYVSIGENLAVAQWTNRGVDVAGDRGIPYSAMMTHPALPVTGLNGDWMRPDPLKINDLANPMQVIDYAKDNSSQSWRILGNAYLEVRPVDGLTLKTNLGIEHSQYLNRTLNRSINPTNVNSMSEAYGQGDTWTWTNTANYLKKFGKNSIAVLLGTEAIGYTFRDLSAARENYKFEDNDFMQIGSGTGKQTNGGGRTQWSVFSLFGKADYNYDDRYLASFTIRRDANSRFAKKNRAGVFPAFSVAWRPTQEAFFPENTVLTDLKIRYSWGQNGNANIPELYPAYTRYTDVSNSAYYDINGVGSQAQPGIIRATTGNPDLKWETTYQNNIGIDAQLFGGAVNITADYFIKKTKDMLTIPPTLSVAGENSAMWLNTGDMKNNGWEIQIGYNSPQYGDFSWSGNFNIAQYKNKLIRLNDQQEFVGGDARLIPGQPMGVYYGYVCDGIFQNAQQVANHATQHGAAPGRLIYRDLNGDGQITDADRCIIGDPNADVSLGLNLMFSYKAFTLDMFFAGDFGFDIQNHMKRALYNFSYGLPNLNRGEDILNAWTPTNTDTDIPALSRTDDNDEARFSTYYVQDGSYMKMKYLKLSYELPKSVTGKWAQKLNVYAQVENVFTATKYKGLDPEIMPIGEWGARTDNGAYPRPRTFTLGLNLQF